MDRTQEIFTNALNKLMEEKGVKQIDISKGLGIAVSAVNRWVHGTACPRANVLQRLADFFDVDISEFVYEKDPQGNEPEGLSLEQQRLIKLVCSMTPAEVKALRSIVDQVLSLRDQQPVEALHSSASESVQ